MSDPTTMRRMKTTLTREDLERDNRDVRVISGAVSAGGMETRCSEDFATLPCRTDIWKRS